MKTLRFCGASVPAIGQGTWHMGEPSSDRAAEARALRLGLDLGMTLIDTAEMYADGGSEQVVAQAIEGRRDDVFLVSKALPNNASRARLKVACERSLARLQTDRIDLYLLHWRGSVSLAETVAGFEALRAEGKILHWGVSNLDPDDLAELFAVAGEDSCATDQILYNPEHRGIEFDLLPLCARHAMPVMAYSPVGQGGRLLRHQALLKIAERRSATPAQVALAWAIRHGHALAIPKASDAAHVRANAQAGAMTLDEQDIAEIDAAFPPPTRATPMAML